MKRVLLADADRSNAEVLAMALKGEGYELLLAHSLEEWIEILDKKNMDLILLDESFLTISRLLFSLSKKAYKKLQKTSLVIMTLYPEIIEHRQKFPQKAKFLLKPFHADEMFMVIRQVFFERSGVLV